MKISFESNHKEDNEYINKFKVKTLPRLGDEIFFQDYRYGFIVLKIIIHYYTDTFEGPIEEVFVIVKRLVEYEEEFNRKWDDLR
jgi:hypothetical protein